MALSDKEWDAFVKEYGLIQFIISGTKEVSVIGLRREFDALKAERDEWKQRWSDADDAARYARETWQTERAVLEQERDEALADNAALLEHAIRLYRAAPATRAEHPSDQVEQWDRTKDAHTVLMRNKHPGAALLEHMKRLEDALLKIGDVETHPLRAESGWHTKHCATARLEYGAKGCVDGCASIHALLEGSPCSNQRTE